jgi:hypothetical protein
MATASQGHTLETVVLSRLEQENILLRPFAIHLTTPVPDGVLEEFIPWHLTVNPSSAQGLDDV